MAARKLVKHALYRCAYRLQQPDCPHMVGRQMTVVADSLEEAVARVTAHEVGCGELAFSEVKRESIEVWS
jgi:hypothetical protein